MEMRLVYTKSQVDALSAQGKALTPLISTLLAGRRGDVKHPIFAITDICIVQTVRRSVTRLVLDDGERCIQAVIHPRLESNIPLSDNDYLEDGDLIGKLVKLKEFMIEMKEDRKSGKNVVILLIRDMEILPQPGLQLPWIAQSPVPMSRPGKEHELMPASTPQQFRHPPQFLSLSPQKPPPVATTQIQDGDTLISNAGIADKVDNDEEDAFETMKVDPTRLAQRQNALRQPIPALHSNPHSKKPSLFPLSSSTPLRLTLLHKIPYLPYKQNWSISTLCVISSLSSVEPSHLPPYTQRTARLAHPSTNKRVHLTVFLDPEKFEPREGRVVLLVGVKNHRFDGGSLKKYASDAPPDGERWWIQDPGFAWCEKEAAELRRWWDGAGMKTLGDGGRVREGEGEEDGQHGRGGFQS